MLEQDLRSQIEEVRRFVEQQQIWLVQEERRELHAGLPAAREFLDGSGQMGSLEFELAGDLAALPVGLAAVAHQELERRLAGQKRIVLAKVAEPQPGMTDHVSRVEVLLAEDHPEQRAFAGTVAAHEPDLAVIGDRRRCAVEQHLVAIPLRGILNVEQYRHRLSVIPVPDRSRVEIVTWRLHGNLLIP